MIPIYIGYDSVENVAYHVLQHSIMSLASEPCSFTPVGAEVLPPTLWYRDRGEYDSTQFSNARFVVPALQNKGWCIFMDCDMICAADIAKLWAQRRNEYAVMVVKHEQEVKDATKFLGAKQTEYGRKNWSSLMMFNCDHAAYAGDWLSYINSAPGLDLHQFAWCEDDDVGEIEGDWNTLLDPAHHAQNAASLSHFTLGGPWHGWTNYMESDLWALELQSMLGGPNPRAKVNVNSDGDCVFFSGVYYGGYHDRADI